MLALSKNKHIRPTERAMTRLTGLDAFIARKAKIDERLARLPKRITDMAIFRKGEDAAWQAIVVDMLRRPEGTTTTELVQVTGWVPHTVRGCFAMAPHGQPLAPYAMGAKPCASGGSTFIAN
jgi:hypothetical protein